jgi:hypothetical protein
VPYLHVIVPAGTAVGQTVDAKIGKATELVTPLGEMTLQVEPDDDVCRIVSAITEDGETTMYVLKGAPAKPRCTIGRARTTTSTSARTRSAFVKPADAPLASRSSKQAGHTQGRATPFDFATPFDAALSSPACGALPPRFSRHEAPRL